MKYVALAGTHAWGDSWIHADSDFGRMMTAEGFELLTMGGRAFRWSTALDGLLGADQDWEAAADALYFFLCRTPFEHRNVIAHSHSGQIALFLAASGLKLRTLTTVGTPVRDDVPVQRAERYITLHQHIYDLHRDWWGWLGKFGDHELSLSRAFQDPHVLNLPVANIRHAKILRDPEHVALWKTQGWLWNIRAAAAVPYVGGAHV